MSAAKKSRSSLEAGRSGSGADRRWILELLDGSRARHDASRSEIDADAFVYFAHLSAVQQLTDIFYRRLLKPHRISHSDFRVISSLWVRGEGFRATPLDLNRFTQITSAGMTRTLDRLEEAGYIDRSPNPADRRSILIGLTPSGFEFAETLGRDVGAEYAAALDGANPADVKAETDRLRAVVERLAQAVIDEP